MIKSLLILYVSFLAYSIYFLMISGWMIIFEFLFRKYKRFLVKVIFRARKRFLDILNFLNYDFLFMIWESIFNWFENFLSSILLRYRWLNFFKSFINLSKRLMFGMVILITNHFFNFLKVNFFIFYVMFNTCFS